MDVHRIILLVYPYIAIAAVGMGLIWHYDEGKTDQIDSRGKKEKTIEKVVVKVLLFLCMATGLLIIVDYDLVYQPKQLFLWVTSLIKLQPDMDIVQHLSILSRVHLILLFTFLLALSFTRYLIYIARPYKFFKEGISRIRKNIHNR
ncbi:respiratory nitrate reductase subunit gamma [Bacillus sp. V5-8f]|uniref:respiratory nitrate reductase subunit gamma n=1 Tax=Bacillus sp. V5-8f TaxID=2053044 RepID=UPI0015E08740|nr:respiratory nitrate reductase subunit gamma [Bacillus sp. V5-8f]